MIKQIRNVWISGILCMVPLLYGNVEEPFVVGALLGQVGNQMFEIAATSALAWDHGVKAYFPDLSPISVDYRHFFFRCDISSPPGPIEFEAGNYMFNYQEIPYRPNMKLTGYLQNEKYFAHQRERILQLFAPHPKDLQYIQKKYRAILADPVSVSVHLRYYQREKPGEDSFIQYEKEYFEKAMAVFPQDALFVVISDNIPFAKENIPTEGRRVIFIENEPYYIDFHLQSLCKHNIICNSTFSWWGAWLNQNPDKIVVRPERWLGGYDDITNPDNWIRVAATGLQEKRKLGIL